MERGNDRGAQSLLLARRLPVHRAHPAADARQRAGGARRLPDRAAAHPGAARGAHHGPAHLLALPAPDVLHRRVDRARPRHRFRRARLLEPDADGGAPGRQVARQQPGRRRGGRRRLRRLRHRPPGAGEGGARRPPVPPRLGAAAPPHRPAVDRLRHCRAGGDRRPLRLLCDLPGGDLLHRLPRRHRPSQLGGQLAALAGAAMERHQCLRARPPGAGALPPLRPRTRRTLHRRRRARLPPPAAGRHRHPPPPLPRPSGPAGARLRAVHRPAAGARHRPLARRAQRLRGGDGEEEGP